MQVYGVIGDPVDHSLSPPMHRAAYEATGLDADYSRFPVTEDVEAAVMGAHALGVDGLNVTVPHKEAVASLDAVDLGDVASRIGAVNTVDLDAMRGHNTDVAGAMRALTHHGVGVDGCRAVVVGAGGAARAVVDGLVGRAGAVAVANRTVERAERLAEEAADRGTVTAHGLDDLEDLLADADLLVNATSVGMEEDVSPVPADALHGDLAVFDVVYTPRETRLLRDAAAVGATTVTGDWMLVFQGAEAFEIWTGEEAPVEAMHGALVEALGASET